MSLRQLWCCHSQPAISPFLGYYYSGVEALNLTGTQGNNFFFVTPSKTTAFSIDGQDPPNGTLPPDGDKLSVRVTGTTGATEFDDGVGNGQWTFTSGQQADQLHQHRKHRTARGRCVGGIGQSGTSSKPLVKVLNAEVQALEYMFYAYEQTYKGGVHVAVADVTGDGVPDLIVSPGIGRAGEVKVYDGAALAGMADGLGFVSTPDAALVADLFPEGTTYTNGLYVAAGDLNGDGLNDFAVSRQRGVTMVREFYNQGGGTFNSTADFSFAPYTAKTINGAVIAAGDTNGDGVAEIITAPGAGSAAQVRVFDAQTGIVQLQINGFTPTFKGGVSLGVGDLDGDGLADIVLGAGAGAIRKCRYSMPRSANSKNNFRHLRRIRQRPSVWRLLIPMAPAWHRSMLCRRWAEPATRCGSSIHSARRWSIRCLKPNPILPAASSWPDAIEI